MRIIRFLDDEGACHLGLDSAADSDEAQIMTGSIWSPADLAPTGVDVAVAQLLPPIEPTNIFCIGLNYREHAKEGGQAIPTSPVIFMKPTTAVVGSGEPIRIPAACAHGPEVDYECELAVVIGTAGRDIPRDQALNHVLGYTCANDVSARRWQKQGGGGQWIRGKSFDTFCPLGPVLVTADEIEDPQDLALRTRLNGTVMQDGHTSDMIFPVAELIAFLSRDTTLLAGTVILTGTPPGVGFARKPPVWLKRGDEVAIEIETIGVLQNRVV
jgi:2-keto-4-pentenoate hydratase/2-oxohepta-3-ene-1,7-dioic acid hydratase in catechol pathway